MRWVNPEPVIQVEEVRRTKQISYISAYLWNPQKMVLVSLLARKE